MPELFSNANLATVQKTYEALNGDSLKERKGSNPFVTLNPESFSAEYSFKNEYERDKYLVSLTSQDLQKAIDWLQSEKGGKDMSNVDG